MCLWQILYAYCICIYMQMYKSMSSQVVLVVKNPPVNAGDIRDVGSVPGLGRKWVLQGSVPWRRKWRPTSVFLPENFHGQRGLVGYNQYGCKELDMTERLSLHISHIYTHVPIYIYVSICVYLCIHTHICFIKGY